MLHIALQLDSLLLPGVAARPCFCLRAWRRKHARRHARPQEGLKVGLGLMPRRLSNGRAMVLQLSYICWVRNFMHTANICRFRFVLIFLIQLAVVHEFETPRL